MYRPIHKMLTRLGVSAAAGAILIAGGMTSAVAEDAYTPTMKDMRSIQNTLERYLKGFDNHDSKLQATAFWDDAVIIGPTGQKMTVKQMSGGGPPPGAAPGPAGAGAPPAGPPGGPPPNAGASGPPPGAAGPPDAGAGGPPPGGMMMTPPSCDPKTQRPEKGWELWHIVANSSFEFQSPTRVRHHAYWFAVCPSAGSNNGAGLAVIGPPGQYDDVLEKRNGEWRLISRTIGLNEKYPKQ